MSDWIRLDWHRTARTTSRNEEIHGVRTRTYASPHEIPIAVRVSLDPRTNVGILEFKYIDDERLVELSSKDSISFFVGRTSRRLFRVVVDVSRLVAQAKSEHRTPAEVTRSAVRKAISDLASGTTDVASRENYSMTNEALRSEADLYEELTPA